jgi:hypothetical protein
MSCIAQLISDEKRGVMYKIEQSTRFTGSTVLICTYARPLLSWTYLPSAS